MAFVWEQRKLGDLVERITRKNKNLVSELPLTISAQYGLIDQNEFFDKRVASKDISNYYLIKNGEFAYNKSTSIDAPWGAIKRLDCYENGVLSTLYIVFRIKNELEIDSNFLVSYYSTNIWNKGIREIAAEGARNHGLLNIAPVDFFKTELAIPKDVKEQSKIGNYFDELDKLITLHQRKRVLRKCLFSIDWEQRKLGELGEITTGSTPSTLNAEYYSNDGIPWVTPTDINALTISDTPRKLSEEGIKVGRVVPANTILCTCIASIGKNALLTVKGSFNQQINSLTPNDKNDAYFLLTESELWSEKMKRLAASGTMQIVNKTEFSEIETSVPNLDEQRLIGSYFCNLDNLITLHQCKSNFCKKNEVNAWEQRKFVEFVKNAAKKNKDNIDLEPYAVTNDRGFIAQKDAHDDFGYMSNVDRTAYNIVPPNSFAYNPARINVGSLGYYEGTENVIVSSLYEVFQTEEYIDDKFLLHWFKSDSFPRWIEKLQEGSVRLYFYFDKLVQCQMMVPSLEEQKRISAYLDSIDQLITLHQWECNINENSEENDEKQRKPIKKLIISEGNLSLVDDMFLLHRMTFLVCYKYILLRLNVVKYKITIIIISNILYFIVSLLIIACYLIVINKQLIILIYVEISVVIIKGDDDYARIRS